MDRFRLKLFGGFRLVTADGESIPVVQRKGAALLAYLGATLGELSARKTLASLLWGQSEERLARQSLRQALRALGKDLTGRSACIICLDRQMVGLDADRVRVDAKEFETLVAQGSPEALTTASSLYEGEFLAGLGTDSPDFEEWLERSRGKFRDLAMHVHVGLIEQHAAAGDFQLAAEAAKRALRMDPFREDVHRQLMQMYADSGMRAAALAQYRECEATLRRELGVSPDEETSRLYESILARSVAPRPAGSANGSLAPVATRTLPDTAIELIGMERQLDFLRRSIEGVTTLGARMVAVVGEAGAGKSALLAQLRHEADRQAAIVVAARARPTEQRLAFAFWLDLLSSPPLDIAGDRETNSALVRRLAFLRGGQDAWDRRRRKPEIDCRYAFDAVVELIEARALGTLLILVVEDLQYADETSLRLLSYVLRHLRQSSVLVLASLRAEDLATRPDLAETLNDLDHDALLDRLPLRPLTYRDVEKLVRVLRRGKNLAMVPRKRLQDMWTLSDGNPGIVVKLTLDDAGEETAGKMPDLPEYLYAELARRSEGLDEAARLIAAAASVIGENIDYGLLARATGLDERSVLRGVEALVMAGLLCLKGNNLAFARGRFRLSQYRSLLPARRRQLHAEVATALADVVADDPVTHLKTRAFHYDAAGRIAEALDCQARVGQLHRRRGASAQARRSFRRVIQATRGAVDDAAAYRCEVEARLGLAEIEESAGQIGAAHSILRVLATDGRAMPTKALGAQVLCALGRLNATLGNDALAQDCVRRAAAAAKGQEEWLWQPPDRIFEMIHLVGGSLCASAAFLAGARSEADRLGFLTDKVHLSAILGLLHAAHGQGGLAIAEAGAAVDIAIRLGEERLLASAMQIRGVVRTWCGDLSEAMGDFDNALEVASLCGDGLRLYQIHGHRGHTLVRVRRFAEAVTQLDLALSMAATMNLRYLRPLCHAWKAWALAEVGDAEAAQAEARAALSLASDANRPWAHSVALRALAVASAHPKVRDFVGAKRAIRMALTEQNAFGLEFERVSSLETYARISHLARRTRRSRNLMDQAQDLYRQMKTALNREAVHNLTRGLCAPCKVDT